MSIHEPETILVDVVDDADEEIELTGEIFGITIKLLVFKASAAKQRVSYAPFVTVLSLVAVQLELSLIFLGNQFSD